VPPEPGRVRPVGSVDALLCGGCRAADAASGTRAIGSAGERLVHTEEVTGSIPVSPTELAWAGRWPSATSPRPAVSARGAEPPGTPTICGCGWRFSFCCGCGWRFSFCRELPEPRCNVSAVAIGAHPIETSGAPDPAALATVVSNQGSLLGRSGASPG
jgi:hypothetical protein